MRAALLTGLAALPALAQPMNRDINPAALGANALPPLANEAPRIGEAVAVELGWAGQASTPAGDGVDLSMTLPFRVEVPVGRRVSFAADGSPLEVFRYSSTTLEAWNPRLERGITRADVRLSSKVALLDEAGARPATAVRVTLKTATGEDLFNRRFLDAPAYQFDVLAAWHLLWGRTRLEAWLLLGFLAWQQGFIGQNDAVAWAGTLVARWPWLTVRLEARGYAGWQRGDKPVVLAVRGELALLPALTVVLWGSRGFIDPPLAEAGLALQVRVPVE